jgi:hypothetical protein
VTDNLKVKKMKDRELRGKWMRALRSGKYKQGSSQLVYPTDTGGYQYCCLGVLASILGAEVKGIRDHNGHIDYYMVHGGSKALEMLGPKMTKLSGLNDATQKKLATLNDDECLNFNQIADFIRDEL